MNETGMICKNEKESREVSVMREVGDGGGGVIKEQEKEDAHKREEREEEK